MDIIAKLKRETQEQPTETIVDAVRQLGRVEDLDEHARLARAAMLDVIEDRLGPRATDRLVVEISWGFQFTAEEVEAMETGRTRQDAMESQGHVYRVAQVEFPQAISAENARRLFLMAFDCDPLERGDKIQAISERHGTTWAEPVEL